MFPKQFRILLQGGLVLSLLISPAAISKKATKEKVAAKKVEKKSPLEGLIVPEGTKVKLILDQDIGSQLNNTNDTFTLSVEKPIKVGGKIVINKGAKAKGLITLAKPAKGYGRSGALEFVLEEVEAADGTAISLNAAMAEKRKGQQAKAVMGAYMTGLLGGGGVKGKKIHIAKGTIWEVETPLTTRLGKKPLEEDSLISSSPIDITLELLQKVCKRTKIGFETTPKIKFFKIDEKMEEPNAYATAKGEIFFTHRMMGLMRSPDEVAVVCGHEMAHIVANHSRGQKSRGILKAVLYGAGRAAGLGDVGANVGNALVGKHDRSQERQADDLGLHAMWEAGYNPMAAVDFWTRFSSVSGGQSAFFSTHPGDAERIKNMKLFMARGCLQDQSKPYCEQILRSIHLQHAIKQVKAEMKRTKK